MPLRYAAPATRAGFDVADAQRERRRRAIPITIPSFAASREGAAPAQKELFVCGGACHGAAWPLFFAAQAAQSREVCCAQLIARKYCGGSGRCMPARQRMSFRCHIRRHAACFAAAITLFRRRLPPCRRRWLTPAGVSVVRRHFIFSPTYYADSLIISRCAFAAALMRARDSRHFRYCRALPLDDISIASFH